MKPVIQKLIFVLPITVFTVLTGCISHSNSPQSKIIETDVGREGVIARNFRIEETSDAKDIEKTYSIQGMVFKRIKVERQLSTWDEIEKSELKYNLGTDLSEMLYFPLIVLCPIGIIQYPFYLMGAERSGDLTWTLPTVLRSLPLISFDMPPEEGAWIFVEDTKSENQKTKDLGFSYRTGDRTAISELPYRINCVNDSRELQAGKVSPKVSIDLSEYIDTKSPEKTVSFRFKLGDKGVDMKGKREFVFEYRMAEILYADFHTKLSSSNIILKKLDSMDVKASFPTEYQLIRDKYTKLEKTDPREIDYNRNIKELDNLNRMIEHITKKAESLK